MPAPNPPPAAAGLLAARAAELLAVRPHEALALSEELLGLAPRDPRGLLILASARRRTGDSRGALELLEPLAARFPQAPQTQYELGVCLADLGRPAEAARVLEAAARLPGAPPEAFRALSRARRDLGDLRGSERASDEARAAEFADPELRSAARMMIAGGLAAAEAEVRRRLGRAGADLDALELLGEILIRAGRPAEAEAVLREVARSRPQNAGLPLATALFHQQKAAPALDLLEGLLRAAPEDLALRNLQAAARALLGNYAEAAELYRELLKAHPQNPRLWANYGRALRSLGRRDEAVFAYRKALGIDPALGEAWWSLSNLKTQPFSDEDVAAIRAALLAADSPAEERVQLNYALGKALEDRGAADAAFAAYAAGARLRRAALPYDRGETQAYVDACTRLLTPEFFAEREGFGLADPAPIFIVGLPRSGSTLLEQILASHSKIEGTQELPGVRFAVRELEAGTGRIYPEALEALTRTQARELGAAYLEHAARHRRAGRPFFIDKAPNNFLHAGLIQLLLPNARIIDARRHPLGACFSAFKQHFGLAQNFSYDLEDLGAYYRDYVRLMAHFDAVTPGRIHQVVYEDVVTDLEGAVRRLLQALDLSFEPQCLTFHETRRSVSTVSSEQVRRPIYREALEQWRAFELHLEPLKRALGPTLHSWRGAPPAAPVPGALRPPDRDPSPGSFPSG